MNSKGRLLNIVCILGDSIVIAAQMHPSSTHKKFAFGHIRAFNRRIAFPALAG